MNSEKLKELLMFFSKDDLRELCEELQLPKSGTKEEIIERIIDELEGFDTNNLREILYEFIDWRLTKPQILKIAKELGVNAKSSDTKEELINKLLNSYFNKDVETEKVPLDKLKKIAKKLRDIDIRGSFRDERELLNVLKAKLESIRDIKVIDEFPQKSEEIGEDLGIKINFADLLIKYEGYEIPVEVKFISKKDKNNKSSKIIKGLGQALLYKYKYGGAILFIYDSTKSITDRPRITNRIDKQIFIVLR